MSGARDHGFRMRTADARADARARAELDHSRTGSCSFLPRIFTSDGLLLPHLCASDVFPFVTGRVRTRSVLVADCGLWSETGWGRADARRGQTSDRRASGSVVRRMLLGSQLRRLRESRGITREAAGYSIRASESKISRMELGRVSFKTRDVEDLLTLYGVTDEAGARRRCSPWPGRPTSPAGGTVTATCCRAGSRPTSAWRAPPRSSASTKSSSCTACCRPRRTPTRSSAAACRARAAAEIDRRVALRLERQKVLVSESAPEFHAVLDEAALRRPYGDREVMRGQLPASDRGLRAPQRDAPGHAVQLRRPRGRERRVHHAPLPRVGPVRRRLSGTAHQRALPGQATRTVAQYERAMKQLQDDSPDAGREPGPSAWPAPTVLIRT